MRTRRNLGASCALAAAALAAAIPTTASASPAPGGEPLEPGENITVVHNIDFIAAFGVGDLGDSVTVEVFRRSAAGTLVQLGTATGALVDTPEGPGLEVNHGPEGDPLPGDCWETFTPDVVPYDLVRVTNNEPARADVDEVLIDDLTFDSAAVAGEEAHYRGFAISAATGRPIPAAELNSGFWRTDVNGADSRGEGPLVEVAANGQYTARWQPPDFGRFGGNVPTAAHVANAERQEFGYGHVAPLPPETQLADGVGSTPGPAPGCEASPSESNSVRAATNPLTLSSGTLTITGTKMTAASNDVQITLVDSAGNTAGPFGAAVTGNDWSLAVPRTAEGPGNSWDDLADGVITIRGAFVHGDDTLGGEILRIGKDMTPPPAPAAAGPAGGAVGGTPVLDPITMRVSNVRVRSRISRRVARRRGLGVSFVVPEGARTLRVELHSSDRRARASRLIGVKDVAVTGAGRRTVRLDSRRTRRLLSRPGLYRLVIQVGDGSQLGPRVVKRIRVVR